MLPRKPSRRQSAQPAKNRIILVLGGAASGKSEAALRLAGLGGPHAFVATGQGLDDEMIERIARHRATRSPVWETIEEPIGVEAWIAKHGSRYRTILLDCVTLWLSNLIGSGLSEATVLQRVAALMPAMRATTARIVIVSNELGLGLVPAEPMVRTFRDLAGRVNQHIAGEADEVHFIISGLSLRLK